MKQAYFIKPEMVDTKNFIELAANKAKENRALRAERSSSDTDGT